MTASGGRRQAMREREVAKCVGLAVVGSRSSLVALLWMPAVVTKLSKAKRTDRPANWCKKRSDHLRS